MGICGCSHGNDSFALLIVISDTHLPSKDTSLAVRLHSKCAFSRPSSRHHAKQVPLRLGNLEPYSSYLIGRSMDRQLNHSFPTKTNRADQRLRKRECQREYFTNQSSFHTTDSFSLHTCYRPLICGLFPCHTCHTSSLSHLPSITLRGSSSLCNWRAIKIHLIKPHLQFSVDLLELRVTSPIHCHVLPIVQHIVHTTMNHHVVRVSPAKRINPVQMMFSTTTCEL